MCILILKEIGGKINKEQLDNSYRKNPDGSGFSHVDEHGNIVTYKSMDYKVFYPKLMEALKDYGHISPFIIHFRIATEGGINLENCHPFPITPKVTFAHNGIISGLRKQDGFSDTRIFNEDILKQLPTDFQQSSATMKLLELSIGYSKLVFLNNNYTYSIVGEKKGEWLDGTWFSNASYKTPVVARPTGHWDYKNQKWEDGPAKRVVHHSKAYTKYQEKLKKEKEEKEKLSKSNIITLPAQAPARSWDNCFYCGEADLKKDMHKLLIESEDDYYCEDCVELLLEASVISRQDVPTYISAEEAQVLEDAENQRYLEEEMRSNYPVNWNM